MKPHNINFTNITRHMVCVYFLSADGKGTAVEQPKATVGQPKPDVKATIPAVKATVPAVKATVPAPQDKRGCECDQDDYHFVSMDEFKSTFARHKNGGGSAFSTGNKYINDSYTVVIPSYKRDNAIPMLLNHFCGARHVHKIVFLWHNLERPVPSKFVDLKCDVPYKFITPKKNSLSNRFILHEEIETEGQSFYCNTLLLARKFLLP